LSAYNFAVLKIESGRITSLLTVLPDGDFNNSKDLVSIRRTVITIQQLKGNQ
jgi:hypothetical protein